MRCVAIAVYFCRSVVGDNAGTRHSSGHCSSTEIAKVDSDFVGHGSAESRAADTRATANRRRRQARAVFENRQRTGADSEEKEVPSSNCRMGPLGHAICSFAHLVARSTGADAAPITTSQAGLATGQRGTSQLLPA